MMIISIDLEFRFITHYTYYTLLVLGKKYKKIASNATNTRLNGKNQSVTFEKNFALPSSR